MNKNRIIASTVLVGALIGVGAPAASAMPQARPTGVVQVQTLDTHRAVSSAAEVKLTSSASTAGATGTASTEAGADRAGERGRWTWIINKLKDLGSGTWKKLKDAAKAGYNAFKRAYERYVPWLVRKTIELGATVYEVYSAVRDFIGL
ncbi:hypothetical protein EAO75_44470 [Streptomyces sp. uw30]|uniref:hypothetical protein n=1 Tax=Streptomyces sp. uw30 TaxID=1828179 RepID=UPI0011CDD064|nr:hypothetical protein [Streptomyces sp. uw30]TXS35457.1 hypothetical protein EAO75_44470 [Streptomyces sp. uw30]